MLSQEIAVAQSIMTVVGLANAVLIVYYYGRLSERLDDVCRRVERIERLLDQRTGLDGVRGPGSRG